MLTKLVATDYSSGGDYGNDRTWIARDITDWEDISTDDVALLRKYKYELRNLLGLTDYNMNILILTQDDVPLIERVAELKAKLKDKIKADEEAAKKRRKAAQERKEKLAIQKAIKERQQLEALARKHGVDIENLPAVAKDNK
jgi:hypothetical protein